MLHILFIPVWLWECMRHAQDWLYFVRFWIFFPKKKLCKRLNLIFFLYFVIYNFISINWLWNYSNNLLGKLYIQQNFEDNYFHTMINFMHYQMLEEVARKTLENQKKFKNFNRKIKIERHIPSTIFREVSGPLGMLYLFFCI